MHVLLDDFSTRPVLDFEPRAATEFERLIRLKVPIGTNRFENRGDKARQRQESGSADAPLYSASKSRI